MTDCRVAHVIDYDSLDCELDDGHAGPHRVITETGCVWWQTDPAWRRP